jgi:hypothetical protein
MAVALAFASMMETLTEDERAWLFKHNPPETLAWSLRSRGLDVECTDPGTLAGLAKAHVRYLREREADGAAG